MVDTELQPMPRAAGGTQNAKAYPAAVGSFSERSPSLSKFLQRGISKTSSTSFAGVTVDMPKAKLSRQLTFAPVNEVQEIEMVSVDNTGKMEGQAAVQDPSMFDDVDEDRDFEDGDISERIQKRIGSNAFKRFLNKIPLMHKALILVLLPVLALFILSLVDLTDSLELKRESEKAVEFTQLVRGTQQLAEVYLTTALWGTSVLQVPDPMMPQMYAQMFEMTQAQYAEFQQLQESLSLDEIFEQHLWHDAILGLERHELIKKKVLAHSISLGELEEYYVSTVISLISSLAKGGSLTSDANIRTAIMATYYQAMLYVHWGFEIAGAAIAHAVGGFQSETSYRLYLKSVGSTKKYTMNVLGTKEFDLIADHYYDNSTQDNMAIYEAVREPLFNQQLHPTMDFDTMFMAYNILHPRISQQLTILTDYTTAVSEDARNKASNEVVLIAIGLLILCAVSSALVALFVSSVNKMTCILKSEVETRQKTEKAVWRFFPQEFISYLNAPDVFHLRPGDRARLPMTVMFAQIMNFAKVSGDRTAEQTYDWLTDFVREMIPIVSQHGGFVDKTTGDGIMALFSTPEGAVYAALEIQAKVRSMNIFGLLSDDPAYDLGIGIHSGEVMLGLLGTRQRLEGTIISDTVNTASRIQGMCKFYGSRIVVSEEVASVVDVESLGCRCLGEVKMKGKVSAVRLYDIYLMDEVVTRTVKENALQGYLEALELYRSGRFQECGAVADHWMEKSRVVVDDLGLRCRKEFAVHMGEMDAKPDGWGGEDLFTRK